MTKVRQAYQHTPQRAAKSPTGLFSNVFYNALLQLLEQKNQIKSGPSDISQPITAIEVKDNIS